MTTTSNHPILFPYVMSRIPIRVGAVSTVYRGPGPAYTNSQLHRPLKQGSEDMQLKKLAGFMSCANRREEMSCEAPLDRYLFRGRAAAVDFANDSNPV
ncbi:unnamed protein product [Nezara viridula]|uniref:Uncharacterized protein n=1 Tax=Nezara viridula TaxID=85310 RepID=A0A9P0HHZ1_NEZVI|nr:unnamed protein product [Nezara viridula]